MANEKRLIDANALTDKFLRHYTKQEKKGNLSFVACEIKQGFADMVNEAPTVDAVEVVRCEVCKHHDHCEVETFLRYVDRIENPYCSAGERKDNG